MSNRKLQVWNSIPILLSILQTYFCQIQSSVAATAYENQTKVEWTVNKTKQTMQINNTINLLSTKTEYSTCIIFELIPGMHPTIFSEAEHPLQETKHDTKETSG